MARIGILGGTFDPVHNGHLALGRQALKQFLLDEVWFMPSGRPPHKRDHRVTGEEDRLRMVQLAIEGHPRFICSDFELHQEGNTYTARTLQRLHAAYPWHSFYFIVGADSLYQIEQWFHPDLVMRQAALLVAGRLYEEEHVSLERQIAFLQGKYGALIYRLDFDEINVSSEKIRRLAAAGCPIDALVPSPVADYIRRHGLYRSLEGKN